MDLGTRRQPQNKSAQRPGQAITLRRTQKPSIQAMHARFFDSKCAESRQPARGAFLLNRRKCFNCRGIEPRRFFLTDVARPLQKERFNAWVFLRRPDLRPTALRRPAGGGAGTMLRHESGKAPPTFWSAVSDLVVTDERL